MKITGSVAEGFNAIPRPKDVYRGKRIPLIWIVLANSQKALIYQQHKNRLDLIAGSIASSIMNFRLPFLEEPQHDLL